MESKNLVLALGFTPKEGVSGIFKKEIGTFHYVIEVDFEKKQFNYGPLIVAESKTTQNFSQPENWVVLECVVRLLEKGYRPQDIILEKTFKVGHGASGGRLDILVKKEGKAFLMIECKTYGKEFDKEFANLHKNGGQLFSYFQNDTHTEHVMLYASALEEEAIKVQQAIVKIEEHYRDAGNVVDVFERWNKITLDNGIFDSWVKAYFFDNKRVKEEDLISLDKEVSTSLFHKFVSILRKHAVSDKPNAFNVIFDLFLAKLWDEKKEDYEELDFQWLENKDDAVDFQYRLLDLYRAGMNDFLEKEINALKDSDFKDAEDDKKLKAIKKKILMLEKVFNIKSVIDEESFEENHRVLKEIVQLLQGYRIRYPRKQQYLSDFFELLLTTGLKQEAGQYFTPPPITRFIVRSLPMKEIIEDHINQYSPKLPAMIDYAAGSGHFLTEVMEEYQTILNTLDISSFRTDAKKAVKSWKADEYSWAAKYIYGVEKDYRLVKVAKVGCYFYGDGLAQVIHGDGLDNFEESKTYRGLLRGNAKEPQFQFVLSNPPYSVSAFKTTLKAAHAEKDFDLFKRLTDRSSEIECLFVERTKQLLKPEGIAAIILPSSVLSNSGICVQTRDIILKSFDIVAITELGGNTFMATNTNTVVLFLRRRPDEKVQQIKRLVASFFSNPQDVTINGIENPVSKYLAHIWESVSVEDYKTLLEKQPNQTIQKHELYQEYDKKIKAKNESEKWAKLLALEQEKLFYFILTYPQKIVLIKTGQKNAEKQFLGYEFSHRRGSEGMHPIRRGSTVDACTQLYDPNTYENPEKAATYIYRAFKNQGDATIPESLRQNVSHEQLVDMLTFDRVEFEKNISLAVKKKVRIESKWEEEKLEKIVDVIRGVTYSKNEQSNLETHKIILTADNISLDGKLEIRKKIFLNADCNISDEKKLKKNDIFICFSSGSKKHLGKVAFIEDDAPYYAGGFMGIIRAKNDNTEPKYLFYLLNTLLRQTIRNIGSGSNINNLSNVINEIKIPLPPLDIQQKIVSEVAVLEEQEQEAIEAIEELKKKPISLINNRAAKGKVGEMCKIKKTKVDPKETFNRNFFYIGLEHIESNTGKLLYENYEKSDRIYSIKNLFNTGDLLYGKLRPYLNKVYHSLKEGICSTDILVLETKVPLILKYILLDASFVNQTSKLMEGISLPRINPKDFLNQEILIPPISEQQKIVSKIEAVEEKMPILEAQIKAIPKKKNKILEVYLK